MNPTELLIQRRITTEFIKDDYVDIVLNRETRATDSMGGRTQSNPTQVAAQRCRVVPARSRSSSMIYTLPTGETISSKDQILLGQWNMDVELKDWFMFEGNAFQVSFIQPQRLYVTICQLDLLGPSFRSTV